jgi:hypothetical protein
MHEEAAKVAAEERTSTRSQREDKLRYFSVFAEKIRKSGITMPQLTEIMAKPTG